MTVEPLSEMSNLPLEQETGTGGDRCDRRAERRAPKCLRSSVDVVKRPGECIVANTKAIRTIDRTGRRWPKPQGTQALAR